MKHFALLALFCACAHAPEPAAEEPQVAERPGTFAEGMAPPVRKKCRSAGPKIPARDRAYGAIALDFLVAENGKVSDVAVRGDATPGAVKAIRVFLAGCSYQPATQDGKPVAVRWKGELTFPTRAPASR